MSNPAKRGRFTPFTLDNSWIVEFPAPGGLLRLGPGKLKMSARLAVCHRAEDDWFTIVDCDVRLADRDGNLWQATSTFCPDWLIYDMIDLSNKQPVRWLRKGPAEWGEALKKRALIRGLTWTFDDRFYRCFWIDGTGIPIQFKYLGADFDVAALSDDRLVVSVKNLFGSWNPAPLEGPDGSPLLPPLAPPVEPQTDEEIEADEEAHEAEQERLHSSGEAGHYDHMPAFAWEIDAGALLFHNSAALSKEEGWTERFVPVPPRFARIKGKGEPQPEVSFQPRQAEASPAEEPPEEGFISLEKDNYGPIDLPTDAGGVLRVERVLRCQVCLDKCPGSEREPIDVLRWRTRLTDASGDLWEAVSHFTPDVFLARMIDLDRTDSPGFQANTPVELAPGPRGLRGQFDDGAWRYAILHEDAIAFHGKAQHFLIDVGISGGTDVQVRLTGLVGRHRPLEIDYQSPYIVLDPAERFAETARWREDKPLPPILFQIDFRKLAFHSTSFSVDDGFWHGNGIPIPVVFRRIGKGEPAADVRFITNE
jgi:hypothetical protein